MMEYEAKFGKVRTGDYVIVVTNDYMHRRTYTTVGMVQDDGYVYCGYNSIGRRQIGSEGCPVCKIDAKLVPEDIAKSIDNAIKEQIKKDAIMPRYFVATLLVTEVQSGKITRKTKIIDKVKKTTLPLDASEEVVHSEVMKNLREHCMGCGFIPGSTVCREWVYDDNFRVETSCEVNFVEVTRAEYLHTRLSEEELEIN